MKKKKFVTDESKLVSTYFDRPHRECECEGECIEFKTCKCGGDMSDKMIVEPLTQRAYFIKKCQDCGYCEVE